MVMAIFPMDFNSTSLLRIIASLILSASLWVVFRRRRGQGTASLSKLRGPPAQSWLTGNQLQMFNLEGGWKFGEWIAKEYGAAVQLKGMLGKKQLYTFDAKAMYHVLIKDSASFKPPRIDNGAVLFGRGLLDTAGEHHRKQRKMLNPVFSIAHMRSMLPIFYDVVDQLENALSRRVQNGPREIDLLGWMARAALELIGQSGFGYSFDNMIDDQPKHKYSIVIKDLFPTLARLGFPNNYVLTLAVKFFNAKVRTFMMNITPSKSLHEARDMVNYMHELSVKIYQEKKRALEEGDEAVQRQIGKGKDLLSILLKENLKANDEDQLPESEVIAQLSTFTFAAMDTTSSGMSRILHLLSLHPKVQDKLRQEIIAARKECQGRKLSYDELVSLPYLDAICRETLRLYSPVPTVVRESTEDVILPLSRPITGVDGTEIKEVFLPKNTRVWISTINANRDPEIWGSDAMEWKPERWLSPFPESVTESKSPGVYSHLMTFGGGSHSCIGFKFSQLEMKAVISMLVEKFNFSLPSDKDIFWQMSFVTSPIVVGGNGHPQLPLIVEAISSN